MTDRVDPHTRSKIMSRVKNKNTKPELLIRKGLFARGFRYRLNVSKLPGKPDLVFAKRKAVIFVNGCFWHKHDCHLFSWPKTRTEWWREKIERNYARDLQVYEHLKDDGWRALIVWECTVKGKKKWPAEILIDEISEWLDFASEDHVLKG